jgi:hypothetical protein
MFSRWIVTNITSARGTLHFRKTRIPCGYQLVICGLYILKICMESEFISLSLSLSLARCLSPFPQAEDAAVLEASPAST